ncbi:MAG TPA: hypothetical protein VG917_01875 [Patescibacteria group bacterium]|nr:hypothetical protein [Patescibacteria group bacterium]
MENTRGRDSSGREVRAAWARLRARHQSEQSDKSPVVKSEIPTIVQAKGQMMWEIYATVPELMTRSSDEDEGVFYPTLNISYMAEDTWRLFRKDNGKPGKFSKAVRKWFNKVYQGIGEEREPAMIGAALVVRAIQLETLGMKELTDPSSAVSLQLTDRLNQVSKKTVKKTLDEFEANNSIYDSVMDRANKDSVIPREQTALTEIIHVSAGESENPRALIHGAEAMYYLLSSVWDSIYPELSKPIVPPPLS